MGKSHIGLSHSQEINESLDKLTQTVRPYLPYQATTFKKNYGFLYIFWVYFNLCKCL